MPDYSMEVNPELAAEGKELGAFIKTVFACKEDNWHLIFQEINKTYKEPGMVLFTGSVETGCGSASSAAGPFYFPANRKHIWIYQNKFIY